MNGFIGKQKGVKALHKAFGHLEPGKKILEISTKSPSPDGVRLSAFNLLKQYNYSLQKYSVEVIYQSSKIFEHGGPYLDILSKTSKDAKKDERISNSGKVVGYSYNEKLFSTEPYNLFFDYLYFSALLENTSYSKELFNYDAFTDIEFEPKTGTNCQAAAAARYVGMISAGINIKNFIANGGVRDE